MRPRLHLGLVSALIVGLDEGLDPGPLEVHDLSHEAVCVRKRVAVAAL